MDKLDYLIEQSIALPIALKILGSDQKQLEGLYTGNVWFDKLESVEETIKVDIVTIKNELYNQFGIIVRKENTLEYKVIKGTNHTSLTYTSEELRKITSSVLSDYLSGSKAKPFKRTERVWKVKHMPPPNADLE